MIALGNGQRIDFEQIIFGKGYIRFWFFRNYSGLMIPLPSPRWGEAPAWDTEKGKTLRHNIDSVILTTFWDNPDAFL